MLISFSLSPVRFFTPKSPEGDFEEFSNKDIVKTHISNYN
jgi:hypothetical protein